MYLYDEEKGMWEYEIFLALADYLRSRGLKVTVEEVHSFALKHIFLQKSARLHHALAVLQHDHSGAFYVLDGSDWVTPFDIDLQDFARDRRCKVILKCQYRPEPYDRYPLTKVKPWTYFETHALQLQPQLAALRAVPKRRGETLFFRGNTSWEGRGPILECLSRRGLVNPDYETWVPYEPYLRELAGYKMVLGLPGMGHLCHREIEAFGVGTPVLMPRLKSVLHDPLIPDHHYMSVDVDTLTDTPEHVAGEIEARFRQVIDDPAYLDFIAGNARRWYEANVRFPNSLALTVRLLGLT